MPARKSIPVPREQRNAANAGRRPSMRDAAQAPWRSSLDLVWSYSRSQAFYGDNIGTSPSFADRHWAGPSHGLDSSVDEEVTEEESDEFDEEGEETLTESASMQSDDDDDDDEYAHRDLTASPAAPMQWADEQLPVNAYPRRTSSGRIVSGQSDRSKNLGRRERRRSDGRERKATNRRLSRIAADSKDDERSRSRSRSPKRLNSSRMSSGLGAGLNARHTDDQHSVSQVSTILGMQREATESTPLLSASSALESAQPGQQRVLRTPSWFRSSTASTAPAKFRLQGYGTSTFWQSWFNTVNALIGVGILALPLAISYAGLITGVSLFLLCGLVTNYTGKVLAHIMAAEPSLRTYADIGNFAFGTKARLVVSFFFCIELWAVSTALIILFGDSAKALAVSSVDKEGAGGVVEIISQWPPAAFKAIGTLIVLPTMFLPLKFLSPISVVGIISVVTLFFVVLADGLTKKHAPGSLWEPIGVSLGPQWSRIPLSFGLIMSGFSTHPIVPSLFKDMKNPAEFCKMLNWAYIAATTIYLSMGLIGYLMFGNGVSDEITRDVARIKQYSHTLNKVAIWLIIINPLSKFALAARPINATLELLLGVEASQMNRHPPPLVHASKSGKIRHSTSGVEGAAKTPLVAEAATQVARQQEQLDSRTGAHDNHSTTIANGVGSGAPSSSAFSIAGVSERGDHIPEQSPLAGSAISIRAAQRTAGWSKRTKIMARLAIQTFITFLIGLTAICLPGFEKVMAFLGAFLACVTCVFGPLLANLRLFHHEMSRSNIILDIVILFVFSIVATLGTVWSFLPSSPSSS